MLATLSSDEAIKAAIEKRKSDGPIRNGLPTEDVLASLRDDTMDVDTAAGTAPFSPPSSILPFPGRQQVTDNSAGVVSPPSDDMTTRSTSSSSSPSDLSFEGIAAAFHRANDIEKLYEGLKGEVSTKTVEIESKNTEIKAKDATIVSLKNKVTEVTTAKDAVIKSLEDKVAEVTTKKDAAIESKNTQLEAKNAKIVSLTRSKTALEKKVSQLQSRQIAPQQTTSDSENDPLVGLDPDLVKKVEGMLRKPDPNGATLDDIAGMESIKSLVGNLENELKHPDLYKKWMRLSGFLLYGPSGTGKTLVAEAIANTLDMSFFVVQISQVLDMWQGNSEKMVKTLYAVAGREKRALIFFDEGEKFFGKRTGNKANQNSIDGIQSTLLTCMNGFGKEYAGVVTVCATNLPQEIDDAFLSRFEPKYEVSLPTLKGRKDIFNILLGRKFEDVRNNISDEDLSRLAAATDGYSGRDLEKVCKFAARAATDSYVVDLESHPEREGDPAYTPMLTYQIMSDSLKMSENKPTTPDPVKLQAIMEFTATYGTAATHTGTA
jgi:SpoVK/Ycf46/Vps4 family AAA+-type ATPase